VSSKKLNIRMSSLMRKIYSIARILPAFELCTLLRNHENSEFQIEYTISDNLNGALIFSDPGTDSFGFTPVNTSSGSLDVSVTFQKSCERLIKCIDIPKPMNHAIIPDFHESRMDRTPSRSDSKRNSLSNQSLDVILGIDPLLPKVKSAPIAIRSSSDASHRGRKSIDGYSRKNSEDKSPPLFTPNGMSSSPLENNGGMLFGKTPPPFNGNPLSLQKTPPQFQTLDTGRIFKISGNETSLSSNSKSYSRNSSVSDENSLFFRKSSVSCMSSDSTVSALLFSIRNAPELRKFQDSSGNTKKESVSTLLTDFENLTLEIHQAHKRSQS
jgi:hypothetical protein